MKITIVSAHSPVWANEEKTVINCIVKSSHLRGEMPFAASASDVEPHGRELFSKLVQGEFGPIAPFAPPPEPIVEVDIGAQEIARGLAARWPELEMFLEEANAENVRGTIRGIGLVWGVMLDDMLVRVMAKQEASKIPDGFKSKITLAAQENIITADERDALHAIRHIRDRCAHEWHLSFSNPRVEEVLQHFIFLRNTFCDYVKETKDLEMLMKLVYAPACARLILGLTGRL